MDEEMMILPDDFEISEGMEATETPYSEAETEISSNETADATPGEATNDYLKVKYNHEEKSLSVDEARELAQLGLFHKEKFQPQLDNFKYFEDLARKNDMSLPQLVEYYKNQEQQSALSEIMDYNEVSEDVAVELLEARKLREAFQEKEVAAQREEMQRTEIKNFIEEFPGVEFKDIPPEVFAKNQMGTPLKMAYLEHKYKELSEQKVIQNKNETNKKSAPFKGGIAKNGFQEAVSEDPFLEGFGF